MTKPFTPGTITCREHIGFDGTMHSANKKGVFLARAMSYTDRLIEFLGEVFGRLQLNHGSTNLGALDMQTHQGHDLEVRDDLCRSVQQIL